MSFVRPIAHARQIPPARGSGVIPRSAVMLVVGVDDETARSCWEASTDADIGFVRVAQGIAAGRAIRECRPTVVAVGPSLWRDERRAVADAAMEVGAHVVDIPVLTPSSHVAKAIVRAALSLEQQERAAG